MHNPPLPSPSPPDMQLSHDQNTSLRLFIGWDVQAVPGWGCSRQPRVPAFWSYDSGVSGSAAEEQSGTLQEGSGLEMAWTALVAAHPWLVVYFCSDLQAFLVTENGNAEALP